MAIIVLAGLRPASSQDVQWLDHVPISFFLLGALVLGILAEDVLCQYGYQISGIFVAVYKRYFLPCCLEFIT